MLWKTATQVTAQVSRTAMVVILARMLTPRDFGIAGLVLVFSGLIQLLSDVGFSASIVQLPDLTEEDCATAFWAGLGVATICFAGAFFAAPYVAAFYGEPRVRWMFVAVASGLVVGALMTTQASLLWRRMEFKALELRGMFAAVVASAVGIASAAAGLGPWALILQALALGLASMVTIWAVSPWKPRFAFSLASLKRMATFSTNVFASRFLTEGDRNADNLLVGRFLGAHALGIYSIGYSVILIPAERLVWPAQNVLIPALASLQNDVEAMQRLWLRALRLLASAIVPTMLGAILVCPELVHVVLGQKWAPAIPVIQVLAWVALIQSLVAFNGGVLQSRNRSGLLVRMTAFAFALDLTAFVVGLHWGVRGVAFAYALTNTCVIVPVNLHIATRAIGVRLSTVARALRGVVEASAAMALLVFALDHFLEQNHAAPQLRLVASVVVGAAAYLLVCAWRNPTVFDELRRYRLRRIATAS